MSIGNLNTNGGKKNNFPYQFATLELLGDIKNAIMGIPIGSDYETRTTFYEAIAAGPGYAIGDILCRYDIMSMPTGVVITTVWFNQTTQAVIAPPTPANLIPWSDPASITVTNPFNLEATQLLIQGLLTTISGDTSNLDVPLSTRSSEATLSAGIAALLLALGPKATEATLLTLATEATLLTRLSKADFEARINTLGQKLMAASTPVVIASDQSAIEVKGTAAIGTAPTNPPLSVSGVDVTTGFKQHIPLTPIGGNQTVRVNTIGISRAPSLVRVPAGTALSNTTAGVRSVSLRVISGANATIGGVAVPNGFTVTYDGRDGDTVGAISYQTGAGTVILISYLT